MEKSNSNVGDIRRGAGNTFSPSSFPLSVGRCLGGGLYIDYYDRGDSALNDSQLDHLFVSLGILGVARESHDGWLTIYGHNGLSVDVGIGWVYLKGQTGVIGGKRWNETDRHIGLYFTPEGYLAITNGIPLGNENWDFRTAGDTDSLGGMMFMYMQLRRAREKLEKSLF